MGDARRHLGATPAPFASAPRPAGHIPLRGSPESIVRPRTRRRIALAASITMGMVVIHAISQEPSQLSTKAKGPSKGPLATPAGIRDVRPDWMTPNTKYPYFLGMRGIALPNLRISCGVLIAWPRQPNVPIQPATARPISSGESSWRKWTPATVTSVCAGNLRARSRTAPPARIPPGSALTHSLGTRLAARPSAEGGRVGNPGGGGAPVG